MTLTPEPASTTTQPATHADSPRLTNPELVQRLEGGLIIALSIVAVLVLAPTWWWVPLAAFLLFDLSQLGYLRSPRVGAAAYNAVHTYVWPAILAGIAIIAWSPAPTVGLWSMLVAASWAFHVAVDRALGYGLKRPDAFAHTHLGHIGKNRDH